MILTNKELEYLEDCLDEIKIDAKNILTFEVDFNTCDAQTANEIFKMLCKEYPEHTIVLLPKNCSIDCYTKDTVKQMAEKILKLCEEIDEN